MTTKEELQGLLYRVEAENGPNRDIDIYLFREFVPYQSRENFRTPHYTYLIDAALSLVERVLPEWQHVTWGGVSEYGGMCEVRSGLPEDFRFEGSAPTVPLAILSAMLKALIAQKETE